MAALELFERPELSLPTHKSSYGHKEHLAIDADNELLSAVTVTPGNAADSEVFIPLVNPYAREVTADNGYNTNAHHRKSKNQGQCPGIIVKKKPYYSRDYGLRQLLTARLTQLRRHQTERLSLFVFFSPNDRNYLVMPEYRRDLSDTVWVAAGVNLFGGGSDTFFGGAGEERQPVRDGQTILLRRDEKMRSGHRRNYGAGQVGYRGGSAEIL